MAIENAQGKSKRKRSLEVGETKKLKKLKIILKGSSSQAEVFEVGGTKKFKKLNIILNGSSSQSPDTTTSAGVMKKCNNNVVEKENGKSKPRSIADQINVKALPNIFMGSNKVHKDQGGCAEPSSTSEQSKSVLDITQEEVEGDLLKKQAAKLKRENKRMDRELRKKVAMCMQLQNDNKLIIDELKQVCNPCVIQMLEAKNPYNNPQINLRNEVTKDS